jgi:predicted esterase
MTHTKAFEISDSQGHLIQGEYWPSLEMQAQESVVILVHGFGVERDNKGMFTELAQELQPAHTVVLFNLNPPRDRQNQSLVFPVSHQAERLDHVVEWARKTFPQSTLRIVSHSLGGVITALSNLNNISECILLAPPHQSTYQRILNHFERISNAFLDESGTSHIPRSNGSVTVLPPEFWPDVKKIHPVELYQAMARKVPTTIVYATEDEVLQSEGDVRLAPNDNLKTLEISGDHNFSEQDRAHMIKTVKILLK